jgi:tetratricopeptide (TPR) repeat protein
MVSLRVLATPALARFLHLRLNPAMLLGRPLCPSRVLRLLGLACLLGGLARAELPKDLANTPDNTTPAQTQPAEASAEPAAPPATEARRPLALVFVTSSTILAENFPQAATLSNWLKPALAATEAALAAEERPPGVLVQITLTPDAPPRLEFAGRPALSPEFTDKLRLRLADLPDLRAPLCSVCLRIQTPGETASPLTEVGTFIPRLFPPDEAALNRYIAADLATQYAELRAWSRHYAIPLLAEHAAASDPQYAGVVALGHRLGSLGPDGPIDTDALTYRNPDYWRAVMEMAPGDLLVAVMPIFLHAAAGEIDRASTLLAVLPSFSRDGTLARQLINDFAARLGPFRRQLTTAVERGKAFHDDGKFDEAIAQHERVLAAYPNSAWARYERFFSIITRDGLDSRKKLKRANKLWLEIAPEVYRCNPLYTSQFGASKGRSVGAMLDRLTIHRLANKPPADLGERLGNFADAALRLQDYGTAALIYWSSLGTEHEFKGLSFRDDQPVPLSKDDVLARYLYCLEKLGVPQWKGEFAGDYSRAFRQLDASLAAHNGQ